MNDRACPIDGCTVTGLARERFACGPHWFGLPTELRHRVSRAWVGYRIDPLTGAGPLLKAQEDAIAWYRR